MGTEDSRNSLEPSKTTKDHSALVEIFKVLVPAISAIVVAYLGYLQIAQPRSIEIVATQTAAALNQAQVPLTQPAAASTVITAVTALGTATDLATEVVTEAATLQSVSTETTIPASAVAAAATLPPRTAPTSTLATTSPTVPTASAATSATTSASTEQMVMITPADAEGSQVIAVKADTLTFQGDRGLSLRSGEYVPFANLRVMEVVNVSGGVVSLAITYTDSLTATAILEKDNDLLEGETSFGLFQRNVFALKQIEFPHNEASAAAPTQPVVTITSQTGDVAQVIASTLLWQQDNVLHLRSGEIIPFVNILAIQVGEVRGATVPIELTFTNGATQAASVEKDSDVVEGETYHGFFQKNLFALKQLEFPHAAQSLDSSTAVAQPMVTVTTQEGDVAQIIADTLLFQQDKMLHLGSGESVPFAEITRIEVVDVRGSVVAIELTLSTGAVMAATLERDSDVLEGETRHGTFLMNVFALKQVEFPR